MSVNVKINGITYSGINSVKLPLADGSGYAQFDYADSSAGGGDSGGTETTGFSVTNNLTHVTNSNSASTVEQGGSYSATLTAAEGYVLESVTVTMGGVDITSTVYVGDSINIATVSGDIVITATAIGEPVNVPISEQGQNYQDYTLYSDGGTTEIGAAKCVHFLTDEVFSEDTEVEITISNNGSNVFQDTYAACRSQNDIDNDTLVFYYGEKLKGGNWNGTYKFTYTVKAGYRLAVVALGGQSSFLLVDSVTK